MKATYIKTKLQTLINVSKIVTIHYYEFDRNCVFEGERHDFWEMVYVDKGCVQIMQDEEQILLKQGRILFHKPNEFHSIRAYQSAPNFFVISFVCDSPAMRYFEAYQTDLDETLRFFISSIIKESGKVYAIPKNDPNLKALVRKDTAPLGGEQLIKTYLEQLLIFLIRGITKTEGSGLFPTKESMQNHLVVAVKQYIETHLEKTFRVGDICKEFGYGKSYLSRLFVSQTGETLAAYAVRMKIDRAKQLVREGSMNFAQISAQLSFDNPQYFSRVFKRVTGMTPSEFKNSLNFQ